MVILFLYVNTNAGRDRSFCIGINSLELIGKRKRLFDQEMKIEMHIKSIVMEDWTYV